MHKVALKVIGKIMQTIASNGFKRYLIGVRYEGTKYSGWQITNTNNSSIHPSINEKLTAALEKFVGIEHFENFKISSRTDAGVHAIRNCFQVDIKKRCKPQSNSYSTYSALVSDEYETFSIKNALNFYLGQTQERIFITDILPREHDFDCRADSTGRQYLYRIICPSRQHAVLADQLNQNTNKLDDNRRYMFHDQHSWIVKYNLNTTAMTEAAQCLLGIHDFTSFRFSSCQSRVPYREVMELTIDSTEFTSNLSTATSTSSSSHKNLSHSLALLMVRDIL